MRYIKTVLLLLVPWCLQAQNATTLIEKLSLELKTNPDPKRKAVIYSDLTWYYSTVSIDSALSYGEKALRASQALDDSTLIAQVMSDIGAVYFRKGDLENSGAYYQKAYQLHKARNDLKGLAKTSNNLGNIYEKKQQYQLAMSSFLESLQYFESINDQKNIHIIKGNIGLILLKIKNYNKAYNYISEVVDYQLKQNATAELCISCLNLGNVYLHLNDTINALKMYEKSIKACKAVNNKKGMASGYNNIAAIKTEQHKSKDALALYAKSEQERKALNSELDKANYDLNLAKEYSAGKDYTTALKLLLSVEKVFSTTTNNSNLILNYKLLIDIYARLNKADSVSAYVDKLMAIQAQQLENSTLQQTAELETKYQTVKSEKLLLQKEKEAREQQILIVRLSALIFLIALIAFILYRHQRTKRLQLTREFDLKAEIAKIETQNLLQEQRLSISRDLHDNIGSHLSFIISSINNLMYKYKEQDEVLREHLQKIESFAVETISELRDTIWAMDKVNFQFRDLKIRLINYIEKQKSVNPDFKIEVEISENNSPLNSFAGITIYRIIQEFTNNTLKHSRATRLQLSIVHTDAQLLIKLTDNGIGFDTAQCIRGHGLYNMEKRCHELNGEIALHSELHKGTTVTLTFKNEFLN